MTSPRSGVDALGEQTREAAAKAQEEARGATDAMQGAGEQISDVLTEAMRATAGAVSAQASELAASVTAELTAVAEDEKNRGAETMQRFAKAIRTAAQELSDSSPQIADRMRAAATGVDRLSDNIHGKNVGALLSEATEFARSQPAVFFAGAVIAGFALSRFLKSRSDHSHADTGQGRDFPNTMTGVSPPVSPSAPPSTVF
jgi:ABC-type transporter Mla subunit MlaD